ncbi:TerD family protein [Streptomyces tanashiensis]|uniref:TerD family protein n=1 Tax=Streptomyces tanashiensis TaxID=67367 RepID=UPI0033E74F93
MMRGLVKGDNAFVPTAPLRVAVRNGVDVAVLLLAEGGRVRGDADIVFHGAPVHSSGAVRLSEGGDGDGTVWLETGLPAVEEDITRVLVVASTESGTLRDVEGLSVAVLGTDGTAVVGYEVTDAGGETAMVLAELYRRAGGWKFRAVGQGYLDGLTGLAVDHGVDVPEDNGTEAAPDHGVDVPKAPGTEAAPDHGVDVPEDHGADTAEEAPVENRAPETRAPEPKAPEPDLPPSPPQAVAKVVEPPAQVPAAPALAPFPEPVADWTFGAFFEPHTLSGPGNDVISVEGLPPGPVVVELALRTEGYTGVWTLTPDNREDDLLVNSTEEDFRGRLLVVVPENGRLRLKLRADGPWQARVLPLAAARRLSEETMEGWGPDVLLHTGGTADAALHYRGSSNFIVDVFELAGHDDPTALPDARPGYINEIGRRRETLELPEGPLLVHLARADGPWRARLKQPRAATAWLRRARR